MKRSHETLKSTDRSSGGVCDEPPPPPAKDEPLKTENDVFVRSVLRFIDDDGVKDTLADDILEQEAQRRNGDGVNISKHVVSAWEKIDGYSRYSRSRYYSWEEDGWERTVSKPPAQDAKLEAISIFYRVSDVEGGGGFLAYRYYEIRGVDAFLFHFSDGGELDSNELIRAKNKVEDSAEQTKRKRRRVQQHWYDYDNPKKLKCGKLRLMIPLIDVGEIKKVTAIWKSRRNHVVGPWRDRITGIVLETSTNMCLRVAVTDIIDGYDTMNEETLIPEGQTLRSIQIHPDRHDKTRIFHVETVPIDEDRDNVAPTTPLSILAHKAEVDRLQNKATQVEDEAKKSLIQIRSETNESIDGVIKRTRASIQSSSEAAEVRRLHAELAAAKERLQALSWAAGKEMYYEIKEIKSKNEQSRSAAKAQWNAERENVFKEHESYMKRVVDMHIDCGITSSHKICKLPYCRRVFDPEHLTEHKLCSIDKCDTNSVTCGCSVKLCNRCSSFVCSDHMMLHEKHCKEEEDRLLLKKHKDTYRKELKTEPRLSLLVIPAKK